MVRSVWFLLPLMALACADFEEIVADGRCGNRVLEPSADEDCDTFSAFEGGVCGAPSTRGACRYVCGRPGGDAPCPDGWRCGIDGVCRAPSDDFETPVVLQIPGSQILCGDMDGDKRKDVIAVSNTQFTIGYGDADGRFSLRRTTAIPPPEQPPSLADFDGDGVLDFVLPSVRGVHLFAGGPSKRLIPVSIPSEQTPLRVTRALTVRTSSLSRAGDVLLLAETMTGEPGMMTMNPWRLELDVAEHGLQPDMLLTELRDGRRLATRIAVGDVDPDVDGPTEDEIAFVRNRDREVLVLRLRCDGGPCALQLVSRVPFAPRYSSSSGGTYFADADGDGLPDLIATASRMPTTPGDPPEPALLVGRGRGDGTFEMLDVGPDVQCSACLERNNDLSAVVDLNGDGHIDFVTREGLFVADDSGQVSDRPTFAPTRPWGPQIIPVDVNGDGRLDVIASRPNNLDVVLQDEGNRFGVLSAGTEDEAARVAIGDFDGDRHLDVALQEGFGVISVLFNVDGIPRQRFVMAEFEEVVGMAAVRFDDADPIDGLVVAVQPEDDDPDDEEAPPVQLIRLNGDSSRQMASTIESEAPALLSVTAGRFTTRDRLDVAVYESVGAGARGLRMVSFEGSPGSTLPDVREVGGCPPERSFITTAPFRQPADEVDRLLVLDVWGPDVGEEMGMMNPPFSRAEYTVRLLGFSEMGATCGEPIRISTNTPPERIETVDLDGDGFLDVLLPLDAWPMQFVSPRPVLDAESGLAVLWGTADGISAPVLYDPEAPSEINFEVAAIEADGTPGLELVYATPEDIQILDFDGRAGVNKLDTNFEESDRVTDIEAVDADGDGLDDILLSTGSELLMYRQRACTARLAADGVCVRTEP